RALPPASSRTNLPPALRVEARQHSFKFAHVLLIAPDSVTLRNKRFDVLRYCTLARFALFLWANKTSALILQFLDNFAQSLLCNAPISRVKRNLFKFFQRCQAKTSTIRRTLAVPALLTRNYVLHISCLAPLSFPE